MAPATLSVVRPLYTFIAVWSLTGGCSGAVRSTDSGDDGAGGGAGTSEQTGGAGSNGSAAGPARAAPTMLRRLTNTEYRNTLVALLSLPQSPKDSLSADPLSKAGFDNFSSQLTVSTTTAAQYAALSESLVSAWKAPACAGAETDCAKTFVASFGKKAFRRPLSDTELQRYVALYTDERTRGTHAGALGQVVETMLQSPKFLYRSELGNPADGANRKLTPYEVATALSYLFTGSMPDDELFAAADADALRTPAQIEKQARRLLGLPAAKSTLRGFIEAYAGITRLSEITKNAETYPQFTAALHSAMKEETSRFIDSVLWEGDGTFKSLLTNTTTFVNADLAKFYGLPGAADPTTFVKATPLHRAGLLTRPAVLAAHSKANESFPILRGKFVRVALLCQNLPAPPKVVPKAPEPAANATTRERFAQHASDPACSGCHRLIDPLGFGFENYDGIGQYRETESGKPIDAAGVITDTIDLDGPFMGAVELSQKLASSAEAQQCFALQAFRWMFGRYDADDEAKIAEAAQTALSREGLNIKDLFVSLAKTDAFASRTFE